MGQRLTGAGVVSLAGLAVMIVAACAAPLVAQPRGGGDGAKAAASAEKPDAGAGDLSVTHHQITVSGKIVHYTATAGYMRMTDYDGKAKADVFFVAYTKDSGPQAKVEPKTVALDVESLNPPADFSTWEKSRQKEWLERQRNRIEGQLLPDPPPAGYDSLPQDQRQAWSEEQRKKKLETGARLRTVDKALATLEKNAVEVPQPATEAGPAPLDPATRPITFAFNGGPGSSSVWLHLGALGPKRVVMDPEGMPLPPPYSLVENEESWLDLTDLVFIDPVSTGYSRAVEGESPKQFHGLDEDIQSVGEFIRLYTTKYTRWSSPKFLAGESYGTTRAAGLSGYLQDTYGMYLNGIFLISPVLNFQTIRSAPGNDLTFPMYLPTFTATAWYHKKLPPDLQADLGRAIAESRDYSINEYFTVLAKGNSLTPAERDAAVKKLARLTGLSEQYVSRANLRVNEFNFMKELLRDAGVTVGRLDSRFTGLDANGIGDGPDFDPSMAAITGPYTATLYDYVRRDLDYKNDKVYEILTGRVQPWSYARSNNQYVNVAETLRGAMTRNKDLKVFVGCGYYDLATPFGGAEYTVTHLGLAESLASNVTIKYYDAGHMMYIRLVDLAKLKKDVAEFYEGAIPKR